jgi:hypothetical protein
MDFWRLLKLENACESSMVPTSTESDNAAEGAVYSKAASIYPMTR